MTGRPSEKNHRAEAPARQKIELEPLEYPTDHLPEAYGGGRPPVRRNWAGAIAAVAISAAVIAATAVAVYHITR